jgi:hypothetical protein
MSDNQRQPIHAGGVRIIVRLGHRQAAGDFMAQVLPEWLFEPETLFAGGACRSVLTRMLL